MEFPNVGKQCTHKDCKQLDFLPVECDHCRALFCKDHSRVDSHQCVPVKNVGNSGEKLVRNELLYYNFKIKSR